MLESTEQVTQKSVPKEAMKSIKKAAEGGKINRTEKVEILTPPTRGRKDPLAWKTGEEP